MAQCLEPALIDTLLDQVLLDRVGPPLGKLLVVLLGSLVVSVPLDPYRDVSVILEDLDHGIEDFERHVADNISLIIFKVDLLHDLYLAFIDLGNILVGTAVLVLHAVHVLGLVGALVLFIENAVLVVVRVRASVLILELVLVLGLVRALVLLVRDSVLVVVRIRAPVLVLELVLVLGIVRALVLLVGDAVLVVVQIRASILVLESVRILGILGTLIVGIQDSVTVRVRDNGLRLFLGRSIGKPEERTHPGRSDRADDAHTRASREAQAIAEDIAHRQVRFQGRLGQLGREPVLAENLDYAVQPAPDAHVQRRTVGQPLTERGHVEFLVFPPQVAEVNADAHSARIGRKGQLRVNRDLGIAHKRIVVNVLAHWNGQHGNNGQAEFFRFLTENTMEKIELEVQPDIVQAARAADLIHPVRHRAAGNALTRLVEDNRQDDSELENPEKGNAPCNVQRKMVLDQGCFLASPLVALVTLRVRAGTDYKRLVLVMHQAADEKAESFRNRGAFNGEKAVMPVSGLEQVHAEPPVFIFVLCHGFPGQGHC